MIGVQIGVYRVVRQIGEGGMGAVWLAEHVMLGRPVAIKVLHREASLRPELVQRFFNEAKAATAISDPGIIQIFDFGHHSDGNAYIVMELLDGEPLDRRLHRLGKLPLPAALRILRQVASSLAAAHRRGIIHRDIKPENIFLVRDPEVAGGERTKLLDFGIAKLSTDQRVKTHTSAVMGTPVFMSPEQCRGAGQVDHRSDLYSLGCVLFALLTGRPPFDADGAGEIIAMHLREPPPRPSAFLPGLPPAVDELALRCLSKDREQRYQSGTELAAAIEAIAEQLAAHDPPRRPSTEAEVPTVQRPPLVLTPPPQAISDLDATVPRPPVAMTPIDTEPMPTPPQTVHPQAVPIVPLVPSVRLAPGPTPAPPGFPPPPTQPSVGPNALAHLAQAVTMTPLPEPPQAQPAQPARWPGPGTGQSAPHAIPRAPTGEEATAPFVSPSQHAMPAVPITLETRAAPDVVGGPGAMARPSQAGLTTLSQSAGSGPVARKSGARFGLIAGVVVVGAAVGIAAVTLGSSSSPPGAGSAAVAGGIDSGGIDSGGIDSGNDSTLAAEDIAPVAAAPIAAAPIDAAPIDATPIDATPIDAAPQVPDPAAAPTEPAAPVPPAPEAKPGVAEREVTERHMRAVADAFARWAKDNQGQPCPALGKLGMLLDPDDARDGWGETFYLTCNAPVPNQRIGIVSAGPDRRLGSDDDVVSWKLRALTSSLRGLRWGGVADTPSTPAKPPKKKPDPQPSPSDNVKGMPLIRR